VPVILTSHMLMDWFGYDLDFYGIELVGPVLGSVIFLWGGWPFLVSKLTDGYSAAFIGAAAVAGRRRSLPGAE